MKTSSFLFFLSGIAFGCVIVGSHIRPEYGLFMFPALAAGAIGIGLATEENS